MMKFFLQNRSQVFIAITLMLLVLGFICIFVSTSRSTAGIEGAWHVVSYDGKSISERTVIHFKKNKLKTTPECNPIGWLNYEYDEQNQDIEFGVGQALIRTQIGCVNALEFWRIDFPLSRKAKVSLGRETLTLYFSENRKAILRRVGSSYALKKLEYSQAVFSESEQRCANTFINQKNHVISSAKDFESFLNRKQNKACKDFDIGINFDSETLLIQYLQGSGCKIDFGALDILADEKNSTVFVQSKISARGSCKMLQRGNQWIFVDKISDDTQVIFETKKHLQWMKMF